MNTNPMNFEDYKDDPQLDALLDEALSADIPGGMPAGLNDRILAATSSSLASSRPVIARIGFFSTTLGRIAAALLVAGSAAVAIIGTNIVRENNVANQFARLDVERKALAIKQLEAEVAVAPLTISAAANTFALADTKVDQTIDQLKTLANEAELAAGVDNWSDVRNSLKEELDAMDADPDNG